MSAVRGIGTGNGDGSPEEPGVGWERFGHRIGEARKRQHFQLGMLADIALTTPEMLQEVEAGDLDPGRRLAQDLDRALLTDGRIWDCWARAHLAELLRRPTAITDVLPEAFQVRAYAPLVLPSPYLTGDYLAALDQAEHPMESPQLDCDRPHLPRLSPAGTGGGAPFHCLVVDETALLRPLSEPEVMRAQLVHLHHLSQDDGISVHLVPSGTGCHPGLGGAFWTLSYSPSHALAYVPHPRGRGQIISSVSPVKSYTDLFATLQGAALPLEESQHRLVELASRIRSASPQVIA